MRKLFIVLLLIVTFSLGMVSQNLFAGKWIYPSHGTPAPKLTSRNGVLRNRGFTLYIPPKGWRIVFAEFRDYPSETHSVTVGFEKLEGL